MTQVTITEVRNAQALNSENTMFYVEINHPTYGWIPYTLNPNDTDMTIDNSVLLELIGTDYEAYVAPTQAELDAELAAKIRLERDSKLALEVDPIVSNSLRWNELSEPKQTEWSQYRTDLLNVPQQPGFPNTVKFPTKPTE
mgnify:CR=1 FL=1|tara:strand:- start:2056 stop:2478 length:423 start_codon:yes stop_codon:yes gene_type:complete